MLVLMMDNILLCSIYELHITAEFLKPGFIIRYSYYNKLSRVVPIDCILN